MEPLWKLLLVALIAAIIASMLGTLAARVRFSAPRGLRMALDILFLLPLAIPEMAAFFPPVLLFDLSGGRAEPNLVPLINILAEGILTLPVFYLCALMGFRNITCETIEAARLQGLGFCGIFCRVFLPPARLWLLLAFFIGLCRGVFLAWLMKPVL